MRQVEAILQTLPEVQTYSQRTGLGLGGDLNEANQGDFFVRLKPGPRRGIEEIMDDLRTQVGHTVPGLAIETAQLMEDSIADLSRFLDIDHLARPRNIGAAPELATSGR